MAREPGLRVPTSTVPNCELKRGGAGTGQGGDLDLVKLLPSAATNLRALNPIRLQGIKKALTRSAKEGRAMLIYPVPVEVTHARVQLLVDQTAKALPHVINEDVLDVFAAKNKADRDAVETILDIKV
ncbi:hypothetical protein ACFFWD_20590 [Bradyrhizobium erythrophlei]|uniref:hypothetical protein n=1 Tax=Bradyrhizobium erythrophlei TaxID=1437360 RepID=UPI0035F0C911